MNLTARVKRLEGPAGRCRACYGRIIAIRYDPPPEGPAMLWGIPLPPVECPVCGKAPGIVLTTRPPKGDVGIDQGSQQPP